MKNIFNRPFGKLRGLRVVQYAILTANSLDREETPFQRLQVLCKDRKHHQTVHNMTIFIGDVNDNRPQFTNEILFYQVGENTPIGTVLKPLNVTTAVDALASLRGVLATDVDMGKNGHLKYSLVDNSEEARNFSVDPFTGVLSTRAVFDREANERFTFLLMATDQGDESLVGTGTVQVSFIMTKIAVT